MFILEDTNSVANHFIAELRSESIQIDRLKFRRNLERLGEVMAYEISKTFDYEESLVSTPLGEKKSNLIINQPILIAVLRAALPFYQGFLNFFDQADSGFIGAYRKEESGDSEIEIEYLYQATPDINNKTLILIDPMLATGKSILKTIENLLLIGNPKEIHIVSVIAAPEGIEFYKRKCQGADYQLWVCSLDDFLNDQSYIIPGLGDAGDLCFGNKI
jgi:uracil phosphoribosyltransferase